MTALGIAAAILLPVLLVVFAVAVCRALCRRVASTFWFPVRDVAVAPEAPEPPAGERSDSPARGPSREHSTRATRARFWSYDPGNGMEWHDTADEASSAASDALKHHRDEAAFDGEWSDDVVGICWGPVAAGIAEVARGPAAVDYVLVPVRGDE